MTGLFLFALDAYRAYRGDPEAAKRVLVTLKDKAKDVAAKVRSR